MSVLMLLLLLLLVLLLLAAVGVVRALVRRPAKAKWAVVVLATMVGLSLLWVSLRFATQRGTRVIQESQNHVFQELSDRTTLAQRDGDGTLAQRDGGSAWWPEAVETLHPQCYPTSREAAQALARNITRRLQDSTDHHEKRVRVRIDGDAIPNKNQDSILSEITRTLRQHLASAELAVGHESKPADNGEVLIEIAVQIGKRPPASASGHDRRIHQSIIAGRANRHRHDVDFVVLNSPRAADWDTQLDGRIEAEIELPEGRIQESVRFLDKPWVEPFDVFVSKRPGRHYRLARSWSLATYPQEARQQALAAACSQLAIRVHARATQMARGHAPSLEAIQNNLLLAMNDNQYIVDEFSQALGTNRGGSVWRHAMLVEFTPAQAANAANVAVYQVRRMRTRRVSSFAAFFGLIVLTCVVYGFLNVATRGYYREALLCGTVAIVVIGGAVLLLVA